MQRHTVCSPGENLYTRMYYMAKVRTHLVPEAPLSKPYCAHADLRADPAPYVHLA